MSVCLSVCLFAMHLKTVQANATKLSRNLEHIQEKVDINFFSEKIAPSLTYRRYMKLTNRIAVFQKDRKIGSEGG